MCIIFNCTQHERCCQNYPNFNSQQHLENGLFYDKTRDLLWNKKNKTTALLFAKILYSIQGEINKNLYIFMKGNVGNGHLANCIQ